MIVFNGKNHTSIYYNGKYHNKVYLGSKLVWTKGVSNLYDATVTDIGGYMRYADYKFNINGTVDDNALTYFEAEPNTTYVVTMSMDSRFRLIGYNGTPTSTEIMTNYAIHSLDINDVTSQGGTTQTLEITTTDTDTRVWIGYWTKTGSMSRLEVRNSINVVKKTEYM